MKEDGGMGPVPLSPAGLAAWAQGTATGLGPIDFQDMLDASREYVAGLSRYDEVNEAAPWEPDLTPEQEAERLKRQEAYWDRLMGVV